MKNFKEISSSDNKTFKSWKELLSSKGIKKQNKTLVQGKLIVHEYFKNFYDSEIEILFTKEHGYPGNLGPKTKSYLLDKELFSELNITGVDYPMLCVNTPELKPYTSHKPEDSPAVYLPLGDPKNLGGAIRNCLAFNVETVVLLKESANPYHPLAVKASSGACFYINLFSGPETKDLKINNLLILDSNGTPAHELEWPEDVHLLVGEEGQGPPDNLRATAQSISIPISNKIESLNANQALGIALYEMSIQRKK